MKGYCVFGERPLYERVYRGYREKTVFTAADDETNEETVNDALSAAIDELLNDRQLLTCLAGPVVGNDPDRYVPVRLKK
jgi:hypothetical protein